MEKELREYFTERKGVLIIALLVMLATTIPYLVGFSMEGESWRFSGFLIGAQDGNSYIAKMLSGASGNWLFRSPYSAEPQRGVLAFLPYLVLGKLTAPPAQHDQLVAIYHGFRFIAGVMVVFSCYDFLGLFTKKSKLRLWGTLLAVIGGGLGWVLVAFQQKGFLGSIPLDFISPESFGFLALLGFPHLAAARALLLWGLKSYLTRKNGWVAGAFWLGMGLFQPMFILIAWVIISLHTLVLLILERFRPADPANIQQASRQMVKISFEAVLVSSPLVIYTAYMFLTDLYLKGWSAQNILPSPHWAHYLIAYGLVLPFSVAGIYQRWRSQQRDYLLLAVWLAAFPLLVYAPVTTQRRLAEGIWVALIAGMLGYFSRQETFPQIAKWITALILPSSFFLLVGVSARALKPAEPAFLPMKQVNAYLSLADQAAPGALVLSDFTTGNSLPAWAPVRVVLGHGPESVNLDYWQEEADTWLGENNVLDPCLNWFEQIGMDFLFWGPDERNRWDYDPAGKFCLREMYNSGDYQIYLYNDPPRSMETAHE